LKKEKGPKGGSGKRALKSVRQTIKEAKAAQEVLDQKRSASDRIQWGAGGPQDYKKFHTPIGVRKRAIKRIKGSEKESEEPTFLDFLLLLLLIIVVVVVILRIF
jgi:hypothetical protein